MKTISNALSYAPKKLSAIAMVFATLVVVAGVSVATFGPDRPTIAYTGVGTPGFDHVVFNSHTGVPNIGDERDFMRGKLNGAGDLVDPVEGAKDGDTVKVYMYVHNGAAPSLNASGKGVAKDVTVRVDVPDVINTTQDVTGYISASNATPQEIWDTLTIKSDMVYNMDFVSGSAVLTTSAGTFPLSDEIVGDGVLIGDDALDGIMNGCFEFAGWVTLEVVIDVVEKPQEPVYECTALTAVVNPNDKFSYTFTTETAMSEDVTVNKYVYDFGDGSDKVSTDKSTITKLYPQPGKYDASVEVIFNVGEGQKSDVCKTSVEIKDDTTPVEPPEELPNTGPASVIAGIFGTGVLGYGAYSFNASRSELRNKILGKDEE